MSYTPTEWKTGDIITADKLNHAETGIVEAEGQSSKTADEVDKLKSALTSLDTFCRKEITTSFSADKVVGTGMAYGNNIITCNIPANTAFDIIVNDPGNALGSGDFNLYATVSDNTSINFGTKQKNTKYDLTAEKTIVAFSIYKSGTPGGTISTDVSYKTATEGSLEERVEELESVVPSISDKVDVKNLEHCQLVDDPESSNLMDMAKLVLGKKANPVTGLLVDDADRCCYEMSVTPGDTLYFWAYQENTSNPIYPYSATIKNITVPGVAAYDSNGNVLSGSGTTQYVHSFTVPSGVAKIIVNYLKSQYDLTYKFIIRKNTDVAPKRYYPYYDGGQHYYAKDKFNSGVDYNSILPISTRLPESGFIESLGHMGLSTYYPGNTALSIIGAKKAGMGGVEMDVQITSDGVYVLYHDTNMVRVGGTAEQTIGNMTYQQLQQFDYGAWFSDEFARTPLCTLEEAVKLCKQLNLKVYMDCKTVHTVSEFSGALNIIQKWGMEDNAYWITGSFANCWSAVPGAKIIFAAGSPLTGGDWTDPDGWFKNVVDSDIITSGMKHTEDGHYVLNDDVFLGVTQNHTIGLSQLKTESELARKYGFKYGLYAVDAVEDIANYADEIPYMQYLTSNSIAFQTAMNQHYDVNLADYLLV